jgi:hypothetical protein
MLAGQLGQALIAQSTGELPRQRRLAAKRPAQLQIRVAGGQCLQLVDEGALGTAAHLVQQRHRRRVAARQRLAQQPEQRRDATAGGQQQHRPAIRRPAQLAKGRAQLHHLADLDALQQQAGQASARLTLDRQLDTPVRRHRCQAVAAPMAHAVLRQVQLHMLAGAPAAGVAVAAQAQGEHVVGDPLARLDPGAHPVQAQRRVQQAQPAVDVRLAQPAAGAQRAQRLQRAGQAARQGQGNQGHRCSSSEQLCTRLPDAGQFSQHLYT